MIQRLWLWATRKLLGEDWVGTYGGYTVLENDSVDGEQLSELFELPAYAEPVNALESLPDDSGTVYCWHVDSEEKRERWLNALDSYQDRSGEFDALHIVLTAPEELYQLETDEIEPYLDR